MNKYLSNIDSQINVIFALKEKKDISIDKWYILKNAFISMVLFLAVFFSVGAIFKLNIDIRYIFYSVMIVCMLSTVYLSIKIELKIQYKYNIKYNPWIASLFNITYAFAQVFGFMALSFLLIVPNIAGTIDVVVILFLFLITILFLLYINSLKRYSKSFLLIKLLFNILLYSQVFIAVISIPGFHNPWLVMIVYIALIAFLMTIKVLLKDSFLKYRNEISTIIVVLIFFSIVFYSITFIGFNKRLFSSLTVNVPVSIKTYPLDNIDNITDGLMTDKYDYILSDYKENNDDGYLLSIYTKDFELFKQTKFTGLLKYIVDVQNHQYLINFNLEDDLVHLYDITDGNINEITSYGSQYFDYEPVKIDDTYYLFTILKNHTFWNSSYPEAPRLLSDPDDLVNTDIFTDPILYQDKTNIVIKLNSESSYYVINNRQYDISWPYSYYNDYLIYRDQGTNTYKIQKPLDYINNLENSIIVPESVSMFSSQFYVYDNYYYIFDNYSLFKLDTNGELVDEMKFGYPSSFYTYNNEIYTSSSISDKPSALTCINLNNVPLTKTVFNNSDWNFTLFMIPGIIAYILVKPSYYLDFIKNKDKSKEVQK